MSHTAPSDDDLKIPTSVAADISKKYKLDQVYIIGRKVGDPGHETVTTYGKDRVHCDVAAMAGDALKTKFLDWPTGTTDVKMHVLNALQHLTGTELVEVQTEIEQRLEDIVARKAATQ